jgi:hypothetical protein
MCANNRMVFDVVLLRGQSRDDVPCLGLVNHLQQSKGISLDRICVVVVC